MNDASFSLFCSYTPIAGFHGLLGAMLVAFKQVAPDHVLIFFDVFKIKAEVRTWSMSTGVYVPDAVAAEHLCAFGLADWIALPAIEFLSLPPFRYVLWMVLPSLLPDRSSYTAQRRSQSFLQLRFLLPRNLETDGQCCRCLLLESLPHKEQRTEHSCLSAIHWSSHSAGHE